MKLMLGLQDFHIDSASFFYQSITRGHATSHPSFFTFYRRRQIKLLKRLNGGKKRKWKESANFMRGWSARRKTENDGRTGVLEEIILLTNLGKTSYF